MITFLITTYWTSELSSGLFFNLSRDNVASVRLFDLLVLLTLFKLNLQEKHYLLTARALRTPKVFFYQNILISLNHTLKGAHRMFFFCLLSRNSKLRLIVKPKKRVQQFVLVFKLSQNHIILPFRLNRFAWERDNR